MEPLHPDLQEILACPRCRGGLDLPRPELELVCRGCSLAFPIRGGLPVMLIEEARSLQGSP